MSNASATVGAGSRLRRLPRNLLDSLKARPLSTTLAAMLVVAVAQIAYLIGVNESFRQAYIDFRERSTAQAAIKVGGEIATLVGFDLNGARVALDLPTEDRRKLALITLSAGCPACQQSVGSMRAFAREAELRGYRVIWVTRDPLREAGADQMLQGITGTVIAEPTRNVSVSQLGASAADCHRFLERNDSVNLAWLD